MLRRRGDNAIARQLRSCVSLGVAAAHSHSINSMPTVGVREKPTRRFGKRGHEPTQLPNATASLRDYVSCKLCALQIAVCQGEVTSLWVRNISGENYLLTYYLHRYCEWLQTELSQYNLAYT